MCYQLSAEIVVSVSNISVQQIPGNWKNMLTQMSFSSVNDKICALITSGHLSLHCVMHIALLFTLLAVFFIKAWYCSW